MGIKKERTCGFWTKEKTQKTKSHMFPTANYTSMTNVVKPQIQVLYFFG